MRTGPAPPCFVLPRGPERWAAGNRAGEGVKLRVSGPPARPTVPPSRPDAAWGSSTAGAAAVLVCRRLHLVPAGRAVSDARAACGRCGDLTWAQIRRAGGGAGAVAGPNRQSARGCRCTLRQRTGGLQLSRCVSHPPGVMTSRAGLTRDARPRRAPTGPQRGRRVRHGRQIPGSKYALLHAGTERTGNGGAPPALPPCVLATPRIPTVAQQVRVCAEERGVGGRTPAPRAAPSSCTYRCPCQRAAGLHSTTRPCQRAVK